ncbi:MAG: biotin--[acetyl-CoA-carboxylase] ligase [Candidatus Aminicenantes bacterium]|nr:biotin--[acetyl-CoA-carboxylase] ligase [Candidatus Aminicenantes bacterium]
MKIGTIVHRVVSCSSTNDLAKKKAEKGVAEGTVIIAEEQTKGKGTKGRNWYSAKNMGLYASAILYPENPDISLLPLMAGLAVKEAIAESLSVSVGLRWPNDLLWEEKKLGGILCESDFVGNRLNYVILGIGLNLYHDPEDFPEEIRPLAASLKMVTDLEINEERLLRSLWKSLSRWYRLFSQGQSIKIAHSYERNSLLRPGQKLKLENEKGEFTGVYRGIDQRGGLILEEKGIRKSYFSAQIKAIIHA